MLLVTDLFASRVRSSQSMPCRGDALALFKPLHAPYTGRPCREGYIVRHALMPKQEFVRYVTSDSECRLTDMCRLHEPGAASKLLLLTCTSSASMRPVAANGRKIYALCVLANLAQAPYNASALTNDAGVDKPYDGCDISMTRTGD